MNNYSTVTSQYTKNSHVANMNHTGLVYKRSNFPKWLRKPVGSIGKKIFIEKCLRDRRIHTVCEEAKCPNRNECFSKGTATFLIMGDICTRNCSFCGIKHGTPMPLELNEPERICDAVKKMELSYVVITSVTRDDLKDGGAHHFAETIRLLKQSISGIKVEVLVPDFRGCMSSITDVLDKGPDVFNHNIETVPRIFSKIRPEADYTHSLEIIYMAAKYSKHTPIKSGFMVGLGESEMEVISLMRDLRKSQVNVLTIGQYLQPSEKQVRVNEYIPLKQFKRYGMIAKELGFLKVYSGPFIRSSYNAAEIINY